MSTNNGLYRVEDGNFQQGWLRYNRELIRWKLEDAAYQQFVLSAETDPAADGGRDSSPPLWENLYPRIRKGSPRMNRGAPPVHSTVNTVSYSN